MAFVTLLHWRHWWWGVFCIAQFKILATTAYGEDDGPDSADGRVGGGAEAQQYDGRPEGEVSDGAERDGRGVEDNGQVKYCLKVNIGI